jgi:molecular chaperone GrpE
MNEETAQNSTPEEVSTEQLELGQDNAFAALNAEIEDLRNKALYAQAETQNVRRRLEKEKADAMAYASTGFARDVLSVADNLARALSAIPADLRDDERLKPMVTGIDMTGRELENVFQRHGITKIAAMGEALDPNKHQAMIELEREDAAPGTIVEEMQSGYMIKDRLLRPALVAVAKAKTVKVDLEA